MNTYQVEGRYVLYWSRAIEAASPEEAMEAAQGMEWVEVDACVVDEALKVDYVADGGSQ